MRGLQMNWFDRQVMNWLVARIFRQDVPGFTTEIMLTILNDRIIQHYEQTFYEDNHATMAEFLRENLNNALTRSSIRKFGK